MDVREKEQRTKSKEQRQNPAADSQIKPVDILFTF